ncbi:MAG: cytochrome c-type biogenesis protein CcmH [Chloroflexi bacterium]|nr:cytochrome c-type biogenesis protein CcmH [Chloroflexota bacterium]
MRLRLWYTGRDMPLLNGKGATLGAARGLAVLAVALAAAFLLSACAPQEPLTLEQQAQAIDASLMCPVCPGETIDQSQATLAKQMRAIVREKLAAGETREEILAFFVQRYGNEVLAAPPKQGFNLLAWGVPAAGVLLGLAALMVVVRVMARRQRPREQAAASASGPVPPEELAPYLATVDQEIEQMLLEGQRSQGTEKDRS